MLGGEGKSLVMPEKILEISNDIVHLNPCSSKVWTGTNKTANSGVSGTYDMLAGGLGYDDVGDRRRANHSLS